MTRPVLLFTDFGVTGPYVGLVKAALHQHQPGLCVIDLMADAPRFDPQASAYLLAALMDHVPADAVVLGVVDPGVGTARAPVMVQAGGRWLVGPDNGLFSQVVADHSNIQVWDITWMPPKISATFHGRDLFAPVAAALAAGQAPEGRGRLRSTPSLVGQDWPRDRAAIVYLDDYGNAMTGLRGDAMAADSILRVKDRLLPMARTYGDVPVGTAFWYVNSLGLVEISINAGSAKDEIPLKLGDTLG